MSVIKVNNVSKHFGSLKAVDELSFEVQAGQVFGFLGQNGSGKSTTIRMLLSLIHPTSGSIEIFGNSIQSNRNKVLEEIGAIIERPDLYPYLSAKEHLQLFAKLRSKKITPSSIEDTLKKVGLKDRAKDKVKTFSLGMKQRLGIGIALLHNPSLIILDEPTNGLDPQGISDIRNLIQQLAKEEGKTILVSSHILSEIEQMASHILILNKGKKIADGPIQSLLDPNKMVVHITTTNDEQAIQVILAGSFSNYLLKRKEGIYLSIPHFEIPLLNQFLINAGVGLVSVESKNSLEDYFLQLTSNLN
jgi:ABC-type branched-subunit amino acid transport system ATPase component